MPGPPMKATLHERARSRPPLRGCAPPAGQRTRRMKLALLVPGPFDTVSGGYIYDRRIVGGLRALGHEVELVELAGRHPLPDAMAEEAARAALAALPQDVRPVIDGLG